MARLGEQLIASGVVSADKVEQALRAQVVWGGRLGTNLIELGCIDLDELSRTLGQQHGVPAALARHFEKADPELQAQLPADLAKHFNVVPLVRLSPERIAVVALDPLSADALTAVAGVYGVSPINGIVTSVAAEMRVLYHLERAYKIARPARFLRSKGAGITPFPQFDLSFELDIEVEPEIVEDFAPIDIPIEIEEPVERPVPQVDVDEARALIDRALATSPSPAPEPGGRERRTYLRTLGDDVPPAPPPKAHIPPKAVIPPKVAKPAVIPPPPAPPAAPVVDAPTVQAPSFDAPTVSAPKATADALLADAAVVEAAEAPATARTTTGPLPTTGALGRIAIRRVAVSTAPPDRPIIPTNFLDSTRAIKRGANRDRVAELVIETLDKYVPTCAAGLLLVIRGGVAIGWKHFSRASDGTSDVAVPLDQEGLVPAVITNKVASRCAAEDLGALDLLLLRAVGNGDGSDLVVLPVSIGDQVMCLLAVSFESTTELAQLEAVASAAGAAFARLIRDASR